MIMRRCPDCEKLVEVVPASGPLGVDRCSVCGADLTPVKNTRTPFLLMVLVVLLLGACGERNGVEGSPRELSESQYEIVCIDGWEYVETGYSQTSTLAPHYDENGELVRC